MLISGSQPRRVAAPAAAAVTLAAPSRASCWRVFFVLFAVALAYTCYTQHAWEDYYITYRASKNLATGHGLTFTVGERVHSFTSPLGVLLPALASLLTGNTSDAGALWIFRVMSISAYAGAGVLLWRLGRGMFVHVYPAVFLVLLLATDAKTIDMATNGMESAFVLLFMLWNLWALFLAPERRAVHLGLAWAAMMWTRPDSFIYIGTSAIGVMLFGRFESRWRDRGELLRDYLVAAAIATAVYGPWFSWAWWYYGSPIPHTVVAKGVWVPPPTLHHVGLWLSQFPGKVLHGGGTLGTTFMPPYAMNTEWPVGPIRISAYLSLAVMLVWLVPFVRWEARVTSFVFTIAHFYLTNFADFPAPWYLPIVTMLGYLTLAGVIGHAVRWLPRRERAGPGGEHTKSWRPHWLVLATTLLLPVSGLLLVLCMAWEMKVFQSIDEDANRRPMAEWLKANAASPHDTVVVECLGYVGFFSNLKIYDYPGLCSPEVVEVLRKSKTRADYTHYFPEIINALNPDWVVLRVSEAEQAKSVDPELLDHYYQRVRVFDCTDRIKAIKFLPGRYYHLFNGHFEVYHRNDRLPGEDLRRDRASALRHRITLASFTTKRVWRGEAYFNEGRILAHTPSLLTVPIPPKATEIIGEFGFFPGAYEHHGTYGGTFTINAVAADGTRTCLFSRALNPSDVEGDRGPHFFQAAITMPHGTVAEFITEPPPGRSNAYGWTYWTNLRFHVPETR